MAITVTGGTPASGASGLCSLAQARAACKLTSTASDALLAELIDAATAWAQGGDGCGWCLLPTVRTEYFSPGRDRNIRSGGRKIRPHGYKIVSVTSLHDDLDEVFGASTLIPASDYYVSDYFVHIKQTAMPLTPGERNVQLIYTEGLATIPADLQHAAAKLVAHLFHGIDRQKQGIASESIGDHSLTYINDTVPKEARAIFNAYRRPLGL